MAARKPKVLFVDDEPETVEPLASQAGGAVDVSVRHPEDIELSDVKAVDLILVDHRLTKWDARDELVSAALRPSNGLALAAVLRAHAEGQSEEDQRPTAIAVLSGHLSDLSSGLPAESREHAIARVNDLEWVFEKAQRESEHRAGLFPLQVNQLALAVTRLPASWPVDQIQETQKILFDDLLSLPEKVWRQTAIEDVLGCHPPIHELSRWSHGRALLRWCLHRVLPYPCFLWDDTYLAARLRVTKPSIIAALRSEARLRELLESARYTGILSEFLGRRWWRAGVESILWELTDGRPFVPDVVVSALNALSPEAPLAQVNEDQPVVCVDDRFRPIDDFATPETAVRIQPDDWPPFADQAWVTIQAATANATLGALVIESDRSKLPNNDAQRG